MSPAAKSSARCLQRGHFVAAVAHVGDPPLGEYAERVVRDPLGRRSVPPGDYWRVGSQQRQRHRLGVQREPSVHPQHHGLARPEPAAQQHLGVQPRHRCVDLAPDDQQHPHRVLAGRDRRRLLGLRYVVLVDDDDECQRVAARDRTARAPLGRECAHDCRTGGVPQRRHQGLLQTRPSRASISSASFGPHSPAR